MTLLDKIFILTFFVLCVLLENILSPRVSTWTNNEIQYLYLVLITYIPSTQVLIKVAFFSRLPKKRTKYHSETQSYLVPHRDSLTALFSGYEVKWNPFLVNSWNSPWSKSLLVSTWTNNEIQYLYLVHIHYISSIHVLIMMSFFSRLLPHLLNMQI